MSQEAPGGQRAGDRARRSRYACDPAQPFAAEGLANLFHPQDPGTETAHSLAAEERIGNLSPTPLFEELKE